ncbi:ornithine cyclodeaminase [Roseobacter sp. YSTF-M11]|uniref:Ornithine cyclodeaminase n=1 Tax=Roseobacter insulae TaxID=2859783 RepID=A0A9X1FVG5_9RHOB|nr:ornithine cyclodeaminase [Roseobacter insulae]MBW4708423.1 ornithine cyclodeaminase [Roseobacter insulae]
MTQTYISHDDAIGLISWEKAIEALRKGHLRPRAEVADIFLGPSDATLLNRAAYIEGLGYSVKAVTVMRDNATRDLPTTQGAMMVFEPHDGRLRAMIDSRLVTKIKTVSDSLLGAKLLARPESKRVLIMGAGVIARALVQAYLEVFPGVEKIAIWARRPAQAHQIVDDFCNAGREIVVAHDLASSVAAADIISSATMARTPVIKGEWISAGTHVDLIGAFKADMREADDALMAKGAIFVDSRDTTLHHIGELTIPLAAGVISEADVKAEFYDLIGRDHPGRTSDDQITIFKNGGGAHLDLMIGDYIIKAVGDSA